MVVTLNTDQDKEEELTNMTPDTPDAEGVGILILFFLYEGFDNK